MPTQIMGIINVSPDSFSGDGVACVDSAVQQAVAFVKSGATILDVGGASTHPNAPYIDDHTEWQRVAPVVGELCRLFSDVTISIDTYKSMVAERAVDLGVTLINDVWGGLYDCRMYDLARDSGAKICLMHNSTPWQFDTPPSCDSVYTHYTGQGGYANHVHAELVRLVDHAVTAGVPMENIIADGGLGFGKTYEQSLCLVGRMNDIRPYDCPMLLGASRKGFVRSILSDDTMENRDIATAGCVAMGIASGADIVRVHNVDMMAQVVKTADSVLGNRGV